MAMSQTVCDYSHKVAIVAEKIKYTKLKSFESFIQQQSFNKCNIKLKSFIIHTNYSRCNLNHMMQYSRDWDNQHQAANSESS